MKKSTENNHCLTAKQQMRRQLRLARADAAQQLAGAASQALAQQLMQLRVYRFAQNIAVYLPFNSEFPTLPVIKHNLLLGKHTYIPKITSIRRSSMQFVKLETDVAKQLVQTPYKQQGLSLNAYGIQETKNRSFIKKPMALDIIFIPLLGFDRHGARLGMGGGYYDRALAFKHQQQQRRPHIIGLAYGAQEVTKIPTDRWDVPLDGIITEDQFFRLDSALL